MIRWLVRLLALPCWLAAQPPAELESRRGIHPRLYLDSNRVAELKAAIQTTHAGVWSPVKRQADSIAARRPPAYAEPSDPNDEQLWQRDVGNNLPYLAMAYLMTGDRSYLESAQQWSLASCGYPHWGGARFDGNDLAAGHQLFGLALVYDWLYHDLEGETRATIRRTLAERGAAMARAATTQYWRNSFLQNHLWVNATGLAAVAFAIFDEPEFEEQALKWVALVLEKYRRTEAALGSDGASHEGVGYWSYGVEYMLKFWQLGLDFLKENLSSEWWAKTASYRLYLGLPQRSWTRQNAIVDLADCPRGDWYGPDYLLRRLARINQDGHAQWLAEELARANVTNAAAGWLNLVWHDPDIVALPPSDLPTLRHFPDLDLVSARSDWSGAESLLVFKCGPALGHEATMKFDYDPGSGHVHPDTNHFVLFGNGEWLIRDDGYRWKVTDQHNTLLVDGKGQLGEGAMWFRGSAPLAVKARPRILMASSTPELDHLAGDATEAYPRDSGLRRFVRHLLFLKPDVLIVADEIEAEEPHNFELRFHPEYPASQDDDGAHLSRGKKAALRLEPLTVEEVQVTAAEMPAKDRDGKQTSLFTVRLEARKARWRNAVALSWSLVEDTPVRVILERDGDRWLFKAGSRSVVLDWGQAGAVASGPRNRL